MTKGPGHESNQLHVDGLLKATINAQVQLVEVPPNYILDFGPLTTKHRVTLVNVGTTGWPAIRCARNGPGCWPVTTCPTACDPGHHC